MTPHRQQAIRDVAAAFMLSTSYINDCLVKPYTCDDERIAYAVAQRERVLALEARSACKSSTPSPRSFQEALEQAELQQKEGARG